MAGFMGVGMGMNAFNSSMDSLNQMTGQQPGTAAPGVAPGSVVVGGAAAQNPQQPGAQFQGGAAQNAGWTCECGAVNNGKFCSNCGKPMPAPAAAEWTCECGAVNSGKFCSNCGKPAPAGEWTCECGATNSGKFCSNCGKARP